MKEWGLGAMALFLAAPALAQHPGHGSPRTRDDNRAAVDESLWRWSMSGVARLVYNHQGGPAGDEEFESTNWNMIGLERRFDSASLSFMMMNSLEPETIPEEGSPQLFQTGETFEGRPLVNRQHPHDFFMNLSATYRMEIGRGAMWAVVAPVGEPALGPTVFMHRPSSGENPSAPLGHHWQDSSHITFNVLTLGGEWDPLTLEMSLFHGEEPDEERWDIEGGDLDSRSARIRWRFVEDWSAQASYGFLNEPEALEEGDVHRTTVALDYGERGDRPFAVTFLWGRNDEEHGVSDALLAEIAWQRRRADHFFSRVELVEKEEFGEVKAFTAGYLRDFAMFDRFSAGVGGDLTFYRYDDDLEPVFGKTPISNHLFLRLRWGPKDSMGHEHMHHGDMHDEHGTEHDDS